MQDIKIHFLGAAKTVTGSKFLIETPLKNIMIDCGMFQGLKELRERNWADLAIDVPSVDMVLLTHGHLDHIGYLPRLVKQGFHGPIVGTAPTLSIAEIILKDSAKIHEEEAEKINKEGYSKHDPALPLYTKADVEKTIGLFQKQKLGEWANVSKDIKYRFQYNGHIIGSTFIDLELYGKRFVFSGDVGRPNDAMLYPPKKPRWADYLFLESTYGNRLHPTQSVEDLLVSLIKETLHDQGTLIIPTFAVERLQTLMYLLWKLYRNNKIPNIPIFVDSPMGNNVISVFKQYPEWHKLSPKEFNTVNEHMHIVTSYRETWEVIDNPRPKIIIAGSGMVTGGRVLTYLQQLVDIATTRLLLVGFQAEGTRGRQLQEGAHEIKIYNKYYEVKAAVHHIETLSAHADQNELLDWVSEIKNIPEQVFLIHGEPTALDTLRVKLQDTYHWNSAVPGLYETQAILV